MPFLGGSIKTPQTEERAYLSASGQPALSGVEVLLVEDDPDAREVIRRILESQGASVRAVESASAALKELQGYTPNVLVSDIGMPEMDGYGLIRAIRESGRPELSRLPAVALTAFARSEDRAAALSAGYQVHVAKPTEPDELAGVVAGLAGIRLGPRS